MTIEYYSARPATHPKGKGAVRVVRNEKGTPVSVAYARRGRGWVEDGRAYDGVFSGDYYEIPRAVAIERLRSMGGQPDTYDAA